ncbi:MAG: hypothetical protein ETSY1_19400 [Candidatus Entotheonella factor]|uniref:Glycosyltransferase 2-like domain-containing protein n=1 Tax=Entotheonella factor TaxID=1429438 RepID=W4LK73_ENTF1|nr:glycosyltransferase family 2 protein [Candidatus Entotheonella palauensis]ETW98289.1 MAG: hypothetical protein ETSY1_19400 [Candidatus Entotheonella factor]
MSIAVIVLTYNEARNLSACLTSIADWANELYIVDSGSTDPTVAIARQHGAQVVEHAFESHAKQWQWALHHLPLTASWVLGLDADQRLSPELSREIQRLMRDKARLESGPAGYVIKRKQIFRGRWIQHGGYYPIYLLKLFRRRDVWLDPSERVDHHFHVSGTVGKLQHDLIEDNQNEADIAVWVAKHNRYAALQALEEFERSRHRTPVMKFSDYLRATPPLRRSAQRQLWYRMPIYARPVLYFLYRYLFRLGFLDGSAGFTFHVLQAFWYRLLVDIHLDDLRRQGSETHVRQRS